MKKFLIVFAVLLLAASSAWAQTAEKEGRRTTWYAGGGVAAFDADIFNNPGANAFIGFRNYNRQKIISFSYSAELNGFFLPYKDELDPSSFSFDYAAFVVPEIGVVAGWTPGFKGYLHGGVALGYTNVEDSFWGFKYGFGLDFGKHISTDIYGIFLSDLKLVSVALYWRF
ncbi:MAG: hypothetical protein J5640_05640 [Bacteroidales bacterium]|nr:hypothetical protein [Bacteroidales bacterium]